MCELKRERPQTKKKRMILDGLKSIEITNCFVRRFTILNATLPPLSLLETLLKQNSPANVRKAPSIRLERRTNSKTTSAFVTFCFDVRETTMNAYVMPSAAAAIGVVWHTCPVPQPMTQSCVLHVLRLMPILSNARLHRLSWRNHLLQVKSLTRKQTAH